MNLHDTVKAVIDIWKENQKDIEKRISERVKNLNKINNSKKAGKTFRVPEPLMAYINISKTLTLRFCGQIVAELSVENGVPKLCVNEKLAKNNKEYFCLDTQKCNVNWISKEAKAFRKKFLSLEKNQKECNKIHSPEHQVETNLIRSMKGTGKKSGKKGTIKGYRPVLLFGLPFQMPVPISGSKGKPKHTNRGHIDILARTGKGKGAKLSVWELKKPNISCSELEKAMQQAVIYATSLVLMLRSECGKGWYSFFEFSKDIPKELKVEAVVVVSEPMPQDKFEKKVKEFTMERLKVEKDTIIPRVVYYNDKYEIVPCK